MSSTRAPGGCGSNATTNHEHPEHPVHPAQTPSTKPPATKPPAPPASAPASTTNKRTVEGHPTRRARDKSQAPRDKPTNRSPPHLPGPCPDSTRTSHVNTSTPRHNDLNVVSIATGDNVSDSMTKPLGRTKFEKFRGQLMLSAEQPWQSPLGRPSKSSGRNERINAIN